MIRPRWIYASLFVWLSVTGGRFLAPFLEKEAGFSVAAIGRTLSIQTAISTAMSAVAGSFADDYERRVPGRGRAIVLACGILAGTVMAMGHAMHRLFPGIGFFATATWHTLLRCGYAISSAYIFPIVDGMTIDFLEKHSYSKSDYGKERLFGAISWAITHLILSALLDRYSFSIFYPLSFAAGLGMLLILYLYSWIGQRKERDFFHKVSGNESEHEPSTPSTIEDDEKSETCRDSLVLKDLEEFVSNETKEDGQRATMLSRTTLVRMIVNTNKAFAFVMAALVMSSGQAIVDNLVFLFMEYLGSSNSLMGWTVILTVSFEIPIFQVADQLLLHFGPSGMMLIAGLAYVIRVIGYSLIPTEHPSLVLFLEPLHGVTYACSQSSAVEFVAQSVPASYEASGQGLVYLVRGVGSVFGLFAGGWAEQSMGPRTMYRLAALSVSVAMAMLLGTEIAAERGLVRTNQLSCHPKCWFFAQRTRMVPHKVQPPGDLELAPSVA